MGCFRSSDEPEPRPGVALSVANEPRCSAQQAPVYGSRLINSVSKEETETCLKERVSFFCITMEEKHLRKMPNSIGRRRADSTPTEAKEEISKLKEELSDLRKLYLQDMANVSSDMRALVTQLSTQVEPTPVVEEPAPVVEEPTPVVEEPTPVTPVVE